VDDKMVEESVTSLRAHQNVVFGAQLLSP